MPLPLWTRLLLALAGLEIAAGLAGILAAALTGTGSAGQPFPLWVFALQTSVFAAIGTVLLRGVRGDPRVAYLGAALMLIATSYSLRPLEVLELWSGGHWAVRLVGHLQLDAFLPVFVWSFAREFPRAIDSPASRRVGRLAVFVSLGAGVSLFLANLALLDPGLRETFSWVAARNNGSHYWTLVYGLVIPALPFALLRTRSARLEERRRVALFLAGVMVAAVPVGAFIVAFAAIPAFAVWVRTPDVHRVAMPIVQLLILTVPASTAYSVLVARVLDVRVILRKALQYGVARGLVTAGAGVPFAWIGWQVYLSRAQPLAHLMIEPGSLSLGGALVVGATSLRLRRRVIQLIDRVFFREQYDARSILEQLAESSRVATTAEDLAALLTREIDRALHLDAIAVLIADPFRGRLWAPSGSVRPLEMTSALATQLAESPGALSLDRELAAGRLAELPEEDRQWLVDAAVALLLPLQSSGGDLIGVVMLGSKRSELDFTREDRRLLTVIAAAGATALENRILRAASGGTSVWQAPSAEAGESPSAEECLRCHAVFPVGLDRCSVCQSALSPVPIPYCLMGKFRLEARIGAGGMGVVYRGVDLALARPVAVKTLPRMSPEDALRMRREARAMAAIAHPHLALIYGVETWRGIPILILELLEGGTLADRLETQPLSPIEAVDLGRTLADVLVRTHALGILHRDIKPSNVAYTRDGVAKLLDFGLARIVEEASVQSASEVLGDAVALSTIRTQGFIGTPLYMSPEALSARPVDASVDLWSLAVVLYEAIAGRHPFERASWADTMDAILHARAAALQEVAPHCPVLGSQFLADCLSASSRSRPASALEMRQRLEALGSAVRGEPQRLPNGPVARKE